MYIIPKRDVNILDSNIPDTDSNYIQYISGTPYSIGVEVQYGQDIFRSLMANNTSTPVPSLTTLSWKFIKKANKWAAFDEFNNTKTKHPSKIMYVVESRYVDFIALTELKANNIKLELFHITDDITTATPLWSYEEKLFFRKSYNYTDYITKDGTYKKTFLHKIFPYYATKLKIEITGTNIEVGNIIYNKKVDVGMVMVNSSLTLEVGNLIDIEIDSVTGNITQVPILPRRDLTIPVFIETKDFERVQTLLESFLGKACLFVALEGNTNLPSVAVYGFYQKIRTPIGVDSCEYELLIKGVV